MPGGDGTGPDGAGPMTGRAAGYCAGYGMPGYAKPRPRAGFGRGFWGRGGGRGRGYRHWFRATGLPGWLRSFTPFAQAPDAETDTLKAQAGFLERQLEAIRRRLSALEAEQAEK